MGGRRSVPSIPRRMVSDSSRGKRFFVVALHFLLRPGVIVLVPPPCVPGEVSNSVGLSVYLLSVVVPVDTAWLEGADAGYDENCCYENAASADSLIVLIGRHSRGLKVGREVQIIRLDECDGKDGAQDGKMSIETAKVDLETRVDGNVFAVDASLAGKSDQYALTFVTAGILMLSVKHISTPDNNVDICRNSLLHPSPRGHDSVVQYNGDSFRMW